MYAPRLHPIAVVMFFLLLPPTGWSGETNAEGSETQNRISEILKKSAHQRSVQYLEILNSIKTGVGLKGTVDRNAQQAFISEILAQKDWLGIVALEDVAPSEIKAVIWMEVARLERDVGDRQVLLSLFAERHPDEIRLFRYVPDGKERLMRWAESTKATAQDRILCIYVLYQLNAVEMIPRMKKLIEDKTALNEQSQPADAPATLGAAIKIYIDKLESKNNNAP